MSSETRVIQSQFAICERSRDSNFDPWPDLENRIMKIFFEETEEGKIYKIKYRKSNHYDQDIHSDVYVLKLYYKEDDI